MALCDLCRLSVLDPLALALSDEAVDVNALAIHPCCQCDAHRHRYLLSDVFLRSILVRRPEDVDFGQRLCYSMVRGKSHSRPTNLEGRGMKRYPHARLSRAR